MASPAWSEDRACAGRVADDVARHGRCVAHAVLIRRADAQALGRPGAYTGVALGQMSGRCGRNRAQNAAAPQRTRYIGKHFLPAAAILRPTPMPRSFYK